MQLAFKRVTLPEPSAAGRGGRGGGGGRAATDNGDENGDDGEDGENENDENEDRPRPLDAAGGPSVAAGSSHHLSRSFYGVVNVEPDPVALANGWGLSPALLAYLRAVVSFDYYYFSGAFPGFFPPSIFLPRSRLKSFSKKQKSSLSQLERMVKASDTPCGCVALETLLNIDHAADAVAAVSAAAQRAAAAALEGGGGNDSDDSGGRRAGDDERAGSPAAAAEARLRRANAAAAAARAGAGQPPPALKRAERAPALQTLAECGWLARGNPPPSRAPSASSVVSYGIGPRSFMELGELLRSFEPSPEVLAAWAAQL